MPKTLFQKIWDTHTIFERDDGQTLLAIDWHFCHEGSFHGFNYLKQNGMSVRRPDRTMGMADHYVPTTSRSLNSITNPEIQSVVDQFYENTRQFGLRMLGIEDENHGIVHVVGPEQGLSQPGLIIVCGDSHTSTHGAMGAIAFGIGASEVAHVFATQTLWQAKPETLRINVEGALKEEVTAKDVILAIIAHIGAAGGAGAAIEYAGSAIQGLSMEGRMTVCNMSIEAGARCGMVAPDEKTFDYLKGRAGSPSETDWHDAEKFWRGLQTDPGAPFDREVTLSAEDIEPMVTWGTSPEEGVSVSGKVPDPKDENDANRSAQYQASLDYMGLKSGMAVVDIPIDRAFIGSCTNGRIEDLRAAAMIAKGRKAKVPAIVAPGSMPVKRQAELEGLDRIFLEAGFEWRESGCSMCVGINGDLAGNGEHVASTSNRNFRGRQGQGARTHLMSPASAAAAAIKGHIADVRDF
ncbi:MAG: 3-isopropylmalate dehydratase large subunit [Rhodospirillales bacterium]|jgi:3-isopropylmalate/(R)-2-methylmalate dehydratase large subunit